MKKMFPRLNREQADMIVKRMKEVLGPKVSAMLYWFSVNRTNPFHS